MSRKRYLSTDISVDKKLKGLSDFAALLYTWMIPHADDECRLVAKDHEEINLLVVPNRRKTDAEVAAALEELFTAELIGQDETGHYFIPSSTFYKYQSKIAVERRALTPKPGRTQLALPLPIRAVSSGNGRQVAEKSASSSSSFTFISGALAAPPPDARARPEPLNKGLRLGEEQPKEARRKQPLNKPKLVARPPPSAEEVAKAKKFITDLIGPMVRQKSAPGLNLDERRAILRRQAIQLGGGP